MRTNGFEISRRGVLGGAVGAAAASVVPDGAFAAGERPSSRMRAVHLTTDHLRDPLGIDNPVPRFGWQLRAGGRHRAQRAYRIVVATDRRRLDAPDVWDSGRVESTAQTGIAYGGPPLRSRTRYFWAVDVWDEAGRRGRRSEPAQFETALLAAKDWSAEWIGSGIVLPHPPRVLAPQQSEWATLEPGHTLGQTFRSDSPLVAVVVSLLAGAETAGCVMTLRRDGPGGEMLGQTALAELTGETQGRLGLDEPVEPGALYVELSDASGEIAWFTSVQDAYDAGAAYRDGRVDDKNVDRYVDGIPPDPPPNPLVRKEFRLEAPVRSARLYISGLGYGIAYLNGKRVGDAELDPPCTDYDVRVLYTTHDVTEHVRRGDNALGIALGRGFYATRAVDSDGTHLSPWVAEPQVKAQLEVILRDGRRITIGTGSDWQLADGPTTYDGLYTGESYDARRATELGDWTEPGGARPSHWRPAVTVPEPGGVLEARPAEPIRAGAPVAPVSVTTPAPGVRLYDFGEVLAGWARISGRLPKGTTVRVLYAEKLGPGGRIEVAAPGSPENPSVVGRFHRDDYTAAGRGRETWQPSFTYKGFRYVEVTGTDAPLSVEAVPVHNDLAETMELRVEHPVLQWIVDAARRTTRNALHGLPDPSPMHTKFGWTGNSHFAGQPMMYFFGAAGFFAKWLDDLRLSQADDGSVPIISPLGNNWPPGISATWTGAYPHLVYRHWLTYGDRSVPEKHFPAVAKYAEWASGLVDLPYFDDNFGDWMPPGNYRAPEGGQLVGLAYVIKSLREATALAELLGHDDRAAAWRARIAELIQRFNDEFLDPAANIYRTGAEHGEFRQTSQALALAFGFVPTDHIDPVAAKLADEVERAGRLDTGCAGISVLPYALADHAGRVDLAHLVLGQTEYPSYGHLRGLGATTFWESWEPESRGHNDILWSGPVTWLVERVLGVELREPAWARFRVAPTALGSLPSARLQLGTVRGRLSVDLKRQGDALILDLDVPVNAVAEVELPGAEPREVGSGRYRFEGVDPMG